MAINLTSSNRNLKCNTGQYETDPSTWGITLNATFYTMDRLYGDGTAGNYCGKCTSKSSAWIAGGFITGLTGQAYLVANSKVIVRVKVKVPSGVPIASGAAIMSVNSIGQAGQDATLRINKTVTEATDTWVELQAAYTVGTTGYNNFYVQLTENGADLYQDGQLLVDDFRIFTYEEITGECDLAIDFGNTTVTPESGVGNADGVIDVAITGGTAPVEYSKDNVNWQSSSQFTGLSTGLVAIYVRDSEGCTDTQSFWVNLDVSTVTFSAVVTDESVLGAGDGQIAITTITGQAPFTYSIDGGETFQSGNVFTGLSPGFYVVVVKDDNDDAASNTYEVGTAFTTFEKIFFSKNPIKFTRYSTANYSEDNYQVYIDVRVEDETGTGTFVSKLKSKMPPAVSAQNELIDFNLRQAFRGVLSADPPGVGASAMKRLTDRIKFFKVYYGDVYDAKTEPDSLASSNPYLVVLGGLSKFKWPDVDYFGAWMQTNKRFMTWAPLVKEVDLNQEDYLQYWNYDPDVNTVKLRIKAYFDDDTTQESTVKTLANLAHGHLVQLPAGPVNSGAVAIDAGKNLTKYEVWLLDQEDAVITEVRTYRISNLKPPHTRYLMYLNSLGAYEVLRCTGLGEEMAVYDGEIYERYLGMDYAALDGQYESADIYKQNQVSLSSGYQKGSLAQEWLEYLQDFQLSTKVYDITEGVRRPVTIKSDKGMVKNDRVNGRYVRFTVMRGFTDQSYTPDDV